MKTFSANAQNNNVTLEPLEVKAMRTSTTEKKMPSSVTIITREDIEKTQARTVADALKGIVGVEVIYRNQIIGFTKHTLFSRLF